ncbi:MAG: hypothetical protein PWQ55_24 [Chloroflexota bacterium]|nr:hypothetical protein [Chloroflexota bacterium]
MNNHSEETQEIICANCGRPNLPEAVRCWYCQIELGSADEGAEPAPESESEIPAAQTLDQALPGPDPQQEAQPEEDIPEWLRRIREKEQKERASQAARDQWQQQALFNGGSRPAPDSALAEGPAHKPAARPAPAAHEEREEEQEASQPTLDAEPPVPEQEPAEESEQEPVKEPEQEPAEEPVQEAASSQPQPPAQKPAVIIEEEDEELPPDASSEDLPDGFIKFDSNNN